MFEYCNLAFQLKMDVVSVNKTNEKSLDLFILFIS